MKNKRDLELVAVPFQVAKYLQKFSFFNDPAIFDAVLQPWQFRSLCFGKKMPTQNSFSYIYVGKMVICVGNFFYLP